MATIQEGDLSAPLYGSLFDGTKFWLSLQVPARPNYKKLIQTNGGVLVDSEKDAEICLVDHLKVTPQNDKLYSYEYIDACLKERKLVDLEAHLVVAKKKRALSGSISQSKTTKLGKSGRTLFTQEDDDILFRAISVPGVRLGGNAVYQKLADEYPQHTMHSWRGRWVDHFSKIMPNGPVGQESSNPKPERESPPINRDTLKTIHNREEDGANSDSESDSELFSNFTNADKKLLMDKAEEINSSDHPMKIFKLLSRQYSTHSWQEWTACFYSVILPELRKSDNKAKVLQEERGAAASFHSAKSLQLQSPIQLESRSSESLKKDVTPRNPGPEKDSGSPVTSSTPAKRRLPGNHGFTAPVMLDSEQVAAKLPQWRVVINPTTSSLATPGEASLSAKPQTPQNKNSPQKRKHADDGQTPQVSQAVKRPRKRYASISEVPSTPDQSPRHKRQPSIELGGLVPTSAEKSVEDASALAPKALVEVVKTPVKKAAGESTKMGQVVKISETPAKSPKRPTPEKKPLSKSTPPKSILAKSPMTKKTRLSYDTMSTQAIFSAEIDEGTLSTEMNFDPLWPEDDEVPSKPTMSTAPTHANTPQSKASRANVSESARKTVTETDKAGIEEMHRYLDYCEKKFGLSASEVIQAVERTSGVKANIETLLKAISKGEKPADIPGIWNKEDDEVLMGSDSRKMKELSDRKGDAEIMRRMNFLNLWNLA
ncbi:unnamed protein product [Tuber melanosporum]|uniref:DNA-binding protein RAP1 n=1 Tax=Tuber melanosporum (strain Mel28) TaxID=656061 RepID=D5G813_TUBMM|nr:uncharacterized protein GSTUM_00002701001 [Tuber melanosporum]CAZ80656.1 unnamed protein product [Tuber melanosporum]